MTNGNITYLQQAKPIDDSHNKAQQEESLRQAKAIINKLTAERDYWRVVAEGFGH
jgi:hypothetical protein